MLGRRRIEIKTFHNDTPKLLHKSEQVTKNWIELLVIGYNLCPFAKLPFVQDRIRYRLTDASEQEELAGILVQEAIFLSEADPEVVETTLIIHPGMLNEFNDYLDFLARAEWLLQQSGLEGVIQVASFHPEYQFEGTEMEAPENYTNRSPYPMLHLLREESIESALRHYEHPEKIPERNIGTMRRLGRTKIREILQKAEELT